MDKKAKKELNFFVKKEKEQLRKFLLNNRKNVKKVREFVGFYAISLLGLYSCGGGGGSGGGGGGVEKKAFGLVVEKGTTGADIMDFEENKEDLILNSADGNDNIKTGSGADVVRAGLAKDEVSTGGGDDTILLVGKTRAGMYTQEDVEQMLELVLNVDGMEGVGDSLNDRGQSEAVEGEKIDGGIRRGYIGYIWRSRFARGRD